MGKLTAGMTVRVVGTSDVGSLVLVREAAQTCVIKLSRDGTLKKNVPLDDVEEASEHDAATPASITSPIRLGDKPLALPAAAIASGSSPSKRRKYHVGDAVRARYKKGTKWFNGNVANVRSDGTYDIEYDDGDVETRVEDQYMETVARLSPGKTVRQTATSPSKTPAVRFAVGDKVQARYKKGAKLFAGTITKTHSDGSYDIRYEDGDVETRVEPSYIQSDREVETPREPGSPPQKKQGQVGDKVQARYKRGAKFYSGVITRAHSDGTYDLKYEDGDTESRVEATYIEFPERGASHEEDHDDKQTTKSSRKGFRVGDDVRAKYKGGKKLYPGMIKRVHSDGTYDIKYEDGDVETRVAGNLIEDATDTKSTFKSPSSKKTSSSRSYSVGDLVRARYKGGAKLFNGKIQKVRSDGTYDIKYEDGDLETGVEDRHIEPVDETSSQQVRESLRVGDRVKARYKQGSKFFSGKIAKAHSDGSYDIRYDDGDMETRVHREDIESETKTASPAKSSSQQEEQLRVGAAVKARYKKGVKYYPGKIARVRTDGTFDVEYEDGDVEMKVVAADIQVVGATKPGQSPKKKRVYEVGDPVMARYKKGAKLFRGVIKRVRSDGTYDIKYEDGDVETGVEFDYIEAEQASDDGGRDKKSEALEVGDAVKAKYKNSSKWYPGRISRVRSDGTFDVDYDDGEKETRVDSSRIELTKKVSSSKPKELESGDRVKARYKGGKKYFDATITRVRADGTYDVKYDDGDSETRVSIDMIEAVEDDRAGKKDARATEDAVLATGDVMQAYYKKGKKLYPGKVVRCHSDDTYDIRYDDGDVENRVARRLIVVDPKTTDSKEKIQSKKLQEGDAVMSKHKRSTKMVRGIISRCRTDGTFDIEFDDGEVALRVESDLIKRVDQPSNKDSGRRQASSVSFEAGDNVKARYKKGTKWFPGKITKARTDGTYDIKYEDGDVELSVSSDLIEPIDTKPKDDKIDVGDQVSARYKNGTKWYTGTVKKVRMDGTFDVRYEDGDLEERVKPENIRVVSVDDSPRDSKNRRDSPRNKPLKVRHRKGDTIEADTKGKGRFRRGKIAKVHDDDTIDIEFDDGDLAKRVSARSVRVPDEGADEYSPNRRDSGSDNEPRKSRSRGNRHAESSSVSDQPSKKKKTFSEKGISKGSHVTMRKAVDANARRIGRVKKTHSDGTCDIEYKTGDVAKRVSLDVLLVCSDPESSDEEAGSTKGKHQFKRDQVVLACWRRPSRAAKPTHTDRWDEATILAVTDKATYSIRYRDGEMEDDVPEKAIKPRAEAVSQRRQEKSHDDARELSDSDVVFLLEQLALTLYEEGELRKKPRVSFGTRSDHSSSGTESEASSGSDTSSPKSNKRSRVRKPAEKALNKLFDKKSLRPYQDRFNQYDSEETGRISKSKIIDVVEGLCSSSAEKNVDTTTLRKHLTEWFATQDSLRTHSKFDFETFMIAFAVAKNFLSKQKIHQNMANALEARFASHHESKKQLELWQQKLGFRTFETLQRFFHDSAIPRMYPAQVQVHELASIFDQVTRSAIPNKPIDVYIKQMQLLPHHALQLPEFMCCYYQLHGSADMIRAPAWTEQLELRPVAFVASCLFSNGDPCCNRHGDLVRRLCIGRTPAQTDLIMRFREVFESLQGHEGIEDDATISTSQLSTFASKVVGDPSVLDQCVLALRKRTAAVSLVEIFSTCGFVIDELTSAPSVTNAVEKLRLRTESAEVRRIIGVIRNMCLKVLRFPNNPDYWRIRSDSTAFHQKLGRFHGASSLIESVGFIEYGKSHFELRGARTPDGKRSSCLPKSTLDVLREKCAELDAELAVMDGVESVVSILQRIAKQREHDSPLSLEECEEVLKHLVEYIETVLKNPKDSRCWRIRESNKTFQRQIGYLPFCADLMASIGYDLTTSTQGNLYVLRGTGLKSTSASGDSTKPMAVNASLSNFAFSSVSQQMEWFLWRRKQEIDSLLQDDMEYLVQMLGSSTSAPPHAGQPLRSSTVPNKPTGKLYPYGRSALDTFNKSSSQKAQLTMMHKLFSSLDKPKRGYLLADDLIGSRKVVPQWAAFEMFDLDKDGRVDFADFVGALGPALDYSFDPMSPSDFIPFARMSLSEQVSTLVGRIRVTASIADASSIIDTIIGLLVRIIDQPDKIELRTIPAKAPIASQASRMPPARELLQLAGYREPPEALLLPEGGGEAATVAFVLTSHQQVRFQTSKNSREEPMPLDPTTLSRLQLIAAMLGGHARLMLFPLVSDVGAVARGIGEMRPIPEWIKLLELAIMCLENVLKHPEDEDRYRQLKTTTNTFNSIVSKTSGGIRLFLAIGFRETDRGTLLLPDDVGYSEIEARKLELSVGCQVLRIVEKLTSSSDVDELVCQPHSPRKTKNSGDIASNDPTIDYYKRRALAADLAREEALQRSAHLEKQLEIVSKSQGRRSFTASSLTAASTRRSGDRPTTIGSVKCDGQLPGKEQRSRPKPKLGTNQTTQSIEAEILAGFSPRKKTSPRPEGTRPTSPETQPRGAAAIRGRRGQTRTPNLTKQIRSTQRRTPTPYSTVGVPTLHESSLALDSDAGSYEIVLRSSQTHLQSGALVRIGTENRDLTEERLIVKVDTTTLPNLTKLILHSALQLPHYARDLVFILPPAAVDSATHMATADVQAFIQNVILSEILELMFSTSTEVALSSPRDTPKYANSQRSMATNLILAHTTQLAEGSTIVSGGVCGEMLVVPGAASGSTPTQPTSDKLVILSDQFTLRKLRAVWDGLLIEFGNSKVDQIAWRHLHAVARFIPWIAMHQPTIGTERAQGSASWQDFVTWLKCAHLKESKEEESPEHLLALTVLRQHFRGLMNGIFDENRIFHSVSVDELVKRSLAYLVTIAASPTEARDIAAVHNILNQLQSMARSHSSCALTWPDITYFVHHCEPLQQAELFPFATSIEGIVNEPGGCNRVASVACSATSRIVFLLRTDGRAEAWRCLSDGRSDLLSSSAVLFYTGSPVPTASSTSPKWRSLLEDQFTYVSHGLRDPEWQVRQRQRVATALDGFVKTTSERRTLMSLGSHDSCLVVNATMIIEQNQPFGGGLLFFGVGSDGYSLRPIRRLQLQNTQWKVRRSNETTHAASCSRGVIEMFALSSDGTVVFFQNTDKSKGVVWAANTSSGQIITCIDEFAWLSDASLLFSIADGQGMSAQVCVASSKASYVVAMKIREDQENKRLRCVLTPTQDTSTGCYISAITRSSTHVFATFQNGQIAVWTISLTAWKSHEDRVPAMLIQQATAGIHQLAVFCEGYRDDFRRPSSSVATLLVVPEKEDESIANWQTQLPGNSLRLALYLLENGEVIDVAVDGSYSSFMLTLDVVSCITHSPHLLRTPGLDRVLLQPEAVVRTVFLACEYRRDGVFAQKSIRELLDDIRCKQFLSKTRSEMEQFTNAYEDSVRLFLRCYYRGGDSPESGVILPSTIVEHSQQRDDEALMLGTVGAIGTKLRPQTVLQLWYFDSVASLPGCRFVEDGSPERRLWEFEAFRVRRQRKLHDNEVLRARVAAQRRDHHEKMQQLIASVYEQNDDRKSKERIAEAMLVEVEQLCWLTGLDMRCSSDPVERLMEQIFSEQPKPTSASALSQSLQSEMTRSTHFRPWLQRICTSLPIDGDESVTVDEVVVRLRQWRREFVSIEGLCEMIKALGIFRDLTKHPGGNANGRDLDTSAKTVITQQFCSFALQQRNRGEQEAKRDIDSDYHALLTFIPPRLAVEFILRSCDVSDRLEKCVDVISKRTSNASQQIQQCSSTEEMADEATAEAIYAQLQLRKRLNQRVGLIEERQTVVCQSTNSKSLGDFISVAETQYLHRLLKTSLPSVAPPVSNITVCVPVEYERVSGRLAVDIEGGTFGTANKMNLTVILHDNALGERDVQGFVRESNFLRRIQQFKTRKLFLPVISSASGLPILRSELLPVEDPSQVLVCESLRGWFSVGDCINCLRAFGCDVSVFHWHAMLAFWGRQVLLALTVLEENNLTLTSLSLDDIIVSPDGNEVRFGHLNLVGEPQTACPTPSVDNVSLFGLFVLAVCEALGGNDAPKSHSLLQQAQVRLREIWAEQAHDEAAYSPVQLVECLQQSQTHSSDSSLMGTLSVALLALQPQGSNYRPVKPGDLWCLAFARVDEDAPVGPAAELSWFVSMYNHLSKDVLLPVAFTVDESVDPLTGVELLVKAVDAFSTLLRRILELNKSARQTSWKAEAKCTALHWIRCHHVIEKLTQASITLFESCLRYSEREAAHKIIHSALDLLRNTLDRIEASETAWTLRNEPSTQRLVVTTVRALCVMCGATPVGDCWTDTGPSNPVIAAALWRISESYLRELVGFDVSGSSNNQDDRYPTIRCFLNATCSTLDRTVDVAVEISAGNKSSTQILDGHRLMLWWRQQNEPVALPQRHPSVVVAGDDNSDIAFDALVLTYQALELRFNASRAATSSAPKFRLAAMQLWLSPQFLDRKGAVPLVVPHELPARVWRRLDLRKTVCELLRDPDDRIVFGALSILDIYTRVLRYDPLHCTQKTSTVASEHHSVRNASAARCLALQLASDALITTELTHILSRVVRALKVQGEASTSAAMSSRYGARGLRASDFVGQLCVTIACLVNCLHAGDMATRHWVATGLSAFVLSQAKTKALAFIEVADVNWIKHGTTSTVGRTRHSSGTPPQWTVFTIPPSTLPVQKTSPFELLVRELAIHTAGRNAFLVQHLRATSSTFRQLVESFRGAASPTAHLILNREFGKLSHVWDVIRDVDVNDGTLEEQAQAIEYATAVVSTWLTSRVGSVSVPLVVEKICTAAWTWMITSWQSVISAASVRSPQSSQDDALRHAAVVVRVADLVDLVAVHTSISSAELDQLTRVGGADDASSASESTVFAALLSFLQRTMSLNDPDPLVCCLFRLAGQLVMGLSASACDEQRTLTLIKHGFGVGGIVRLLRIDLVALSRSCGGGTQGLLFGMQMKARLWSALIQLGDRDIVRAIVEEELVDHWLARVLDNDISLHQQIDDEPESEHFVRHDTAVVNDRLEVIAQLEILLHACQLLDDRSSFAVHVLLRDLATCVLANRSIQHEKQRTLTYTQFLRTHRSCHSVLASLAARMVATAKRFVQLVCCLSVDTTTGEAHSAVLAALEAAGVPRDIVEWHQHSEPIIGGATRESQRVVEFWETWPEESAAVERRARADPDRDAVIVSQPPRPQRRPQSVATARVVTKTPMREPVRSPPGRSDKPSNGTIPAPATSQLSAIPLDELLTCLGSEVAVFEKIFQRHAVSTTASREKLLAPSRLAAALRDCNASAAATDAAPPSAPLSFSAFLLTYARRSGLETLWRAPRDHEVVFVRLLPSGRWVALPLSHWRTFQQTTTTDHTLAPDRLVDRLLALHRGLFSRREMVSLVGKEGVDVQRIVAAVWEEASKRPAVQRLLLQPPSPEQKRVVPVSPVQTAPHREKTLSPRQAIDVEASAVRVSVVQSLVSIDLDSARALQRGTTREERRRPKTKAASGAIREEGGADEKEHAEDSLGSDAYSPFSDSDVPSEDSERRTTKKNKAAEQKHTSKHKRHDEAKSSRSSRAEEKEEKTTRSDSDGGEDRSTPPSSSSFDSSSSSGPSPQRVVRPADKKHLKGKSDRRTIRPTPDRPTAPPRRGDDHATSALRRVFAKYDADGDGAIGFADLRRVIGPQASGAELQRWIAEKDRRGVGAVDFNDFAFAFAGGVSGD